MTNLSVDGARPEPTSGTLTSSFPSATLPEEHTVLQRNVLIRATALIIETDAGRWPKTELSELLNYLRLEVLRQVADEEWLLFRHAHQSPDELALLRREHLELHLAVEELAEAASTRGDGWSPGRLARITRDICSKLERHFVDEEALLASAATAAPATAALGSRPHEWYPLTQGPVIEMDDLLGAPGADAVLERLQSLSPGEQVEIRSTSDPSPLWRRLTRACVGDYALVYLERGPHRWRLEITRRADPGWSPHPYA
jgi:hypothetical protein